MDETQELTYVQSECLNWSTTERASWCAWATGLLGLGDMGQNSPFTILASMDLANVTKGGCEALGHETCDCEPWE